MRLPGSRRGLYQSTTVELGDPAERVAWIRALNRHARRPDVTAVLDVSPEVAAQRRSARGGREEIFEVSELQARLAGAYRKAEAFVPGDRVVHIDGDADEGAVTQALIAALDPIVVQKA